MDEDQLVEECENTDPIEGLVLTFNGKSLQDYECDFSIKLPAIPCTSHEILMAISNIANSYQIAYNCAARLLCICAKAEKDYKIKRDELVSTKITALKEAGAKKLPSKETIESMVVAESDELEELVDNFKKWEVIKGWFDMHVRKLTQMLTSAKDISYAVNNTDKIYDRLHHTNTTGAR